MKKLICAVLAIAIVSPFLVSCKKEEPAPQKLTTPVITATIDGESINVSWNMVTNATSYQVEYKTIAETEYRLAGKPNYSPFTITGLSYGNTYQVRVKALGNNTESDYSKVEECTLERTLPQPTIKTLAGITFIDVSWEVVEGATSYKVQHKAALDAEYTTDYTGDGADVELSYKITGLEGGVTYDVRLAADAEGYSTTYSEVASVTTTAQPSTMITTGTQFAQWLRTLTKESDEVAALANDIDMEDITITPATGFVGTLQGQGFAIKNLKSETPLFLTNSGEINNIVLDSSCEFTPKDQVSGAIVKEDANGKYINVVNKASVTYTANAKIDGGIVLGGFVGIAHGAKFTDCVNEGAVKLEATGYGHDCAFLGGFAGITVGHVVFDNCKNAGAVTLNALWGNPRTGILLDGTTQENAGVNIAGFVGREYCDFLSDEGEVKEGALVLTNCDNTEKGVVTFKHTNADQLPTTDNKDGLFSIAGLVATGDAYIYKSFNHAEVNASILGPTGMVESRKEYRVRVGGIFATVWDYTYVGSTKNFGAVNVVNDSKADCANSKAGVGGIVGHGGYNGPSGSGLAEVFYCTNEGDITVSGTGKNFCVGGIIGYGGKQIGNTVKDIDITSTVSGGAIYIGGLSGNLQGSQDYTTIKSSSCSANISVETTGGDNVRVGGLLGRWGGATGSTLLARDEGGKMTPCTFNGTVKSSSLSQYVGFVVGQVEGSGKAVRFGDKDYPMQISGSIQKSGVDLTEISSSNIETYQFGKNVANTTISVSVVAVE